VEEDLEATAVAISGVVNISSSGPVNTPSDGITATSVASATTAINSTISQQNENTLAQATLVELVQSQTVTQRNEVEQDIDATTIAVAGDVIVNRDGDTTAGGNGVNATSTATANSDITKSTSQSNENSASASTTGDGAPVIQGGVSLTISVAGVPVIDEDLLGGQTVDQTNVNLQSAVAVSIAAAGDVTVNSTGNTTADLNGVNAVLRRLMPA
jgi:hypothetical protein